MTIGIAVALHDCVLLVADGRRTDAYEVHTDEAEKVLQLQEGLGLIVFGAEIGTDMALAWMRNPGGLPDDAPGIAEKLTGYAFAAGSAVLQMVIPEQRQMQHIKVGLVAAGIDHDGPYVAGALYGSRMERPASTFARCAMPGTVQRIVLGGEDVGAQAHFDSGVQAALNELGDVDTRLLVPRLLDAAKNTVRFAQALDRTIGGRIQYMVLRRGQPPEKGFV